MNQHFDKEKSREMSQKNKNVKLQTNYPTNTK